MSRRLKDLQLRMTAAAEAMDFEEAARLRDEYALLRGSPDPDAADEIDSSRLQRQQPGAMGLGSSDQKYRPPTGWKPPKKPDPMTAVHKPAGRKP